MSTNTFAPFPPQFPKLPILTILLGTHTRDTAPHGTPFTSAPGEQPIRQSRKTHFLDNSGAMREAGKQYNC